MTIPEKEWSSESGIHKWHPAKLRATS